MTPRSRKTGRSRVRGTKPITYINVLRLGVGDSILVFNGADGEWRAEIAQAKKRSCNLKLCERTREQTGGPDLDYLFAPLKRARLDYMVQKATEMGVKRLRPVLTQHTVVDRVNTGRMRANVIEAAEQCGVLRLPVVDEPVKLAAVLANWDASRRLVFADEGADVGAPMTALAAVRGRPCALIIGPEGGFQRARARSAAGSGLHRSALARTEDHARRHRRCRGVGVDQRGCRRLGLNAAAFAVITYAATDPTSH